MTSEILDNKVSNRRVCLGKIATAHGVRGLVKLLIFASEPKLLNQDLYTSCSGLNTIKVNLQNSMGKYWLANIKGIDNRDKALALSGTELWVDRKALPETEADEYYTMDLIGRDVQDENGNQIGKITAVENFGAGDLLDIQPIIGESYYLPFTKEYVPKITTNSITILTPDYT